MVDSTGYSLAGGISDAFPQPGTPGYGQSNSFGSAPGSFPGSPGFGSSQNPSSFIGGQNPAINPLFGSVGGQRPGLGGTFSDGSLGPTGSFVGNLGGVGSFYNTDGDMSPSDPYGTFTSAEYFANVPKRTRWFNNILRARERAIGSNGNPNASDPNPNNDGQR
jgi:hypothetical protein